MRAAAKLIVLSDLHLRTGGACPLGLDTHAYLRMAIAQINAWHPDADHVAFLGDITDDGAEQTYRDFAAMAKDLRAPWSFTLGNHDNAEGAEVITAPNPETGKFDCDVPLGPGRLVLLDSAVAGASHGRLSEDQLAWLAGRDLSGPTLIALHHPPNALGIWTDRIRLQDDAALASALTGAQGPVQLLAGHVHMTSSGVWRGFPVATMAGGHFRVHPVLETVPREFGLQRNFSTGPLEYVVALISDQAVQLHFERYGPQGTAFSDQQIAALVAQV